MLPVPMEPASAVMKAWKGLSAPAAPVDPVVRTARSASPKRRTWTKRSRRVRKMPLPSSRAIVHGPKMKSAAQWMAARTDSGNMSRP